MAIDPQDDIVQDFLIESREILEGLGEQLVALEQTPEDGELLNAVFRGFHTIKGGAGFLALDDLVDVCHQTEDIFNLLRQGEKRMHPGLMDDVLKALDVVNGMFVRLESGLDPEPAPAALMQGLRGHNHADDAPAPRLKPTGLPEQPEGDISDKEFEALLDALDGSEAECIDSVPAQDSSMAGGDDDEITDDEFEHLLDELHGAGTHGGVPQGVRVGKSADGQSPTADDWTTDDGLGATPDDLDEAGHGPSVTGTVDSAAAAVAAESAPGEGASDVRGGAAEPVPAPTPAAPRGETSVRVDTAKLDDIMNLVGELVLVRNRLANLRGELDDERLGYAVGNLEHVTSDLQNSVMKTRMQPIRKVFGRFPRVIRDLARSLEKEIQLTTVGEETDLDKNLVEALADPLVHLIRNAVDHGLEGPEERVRVGKARSGNVRLSAEQEGDHIRLTIADDGRGMDAEKLRQRAIDKGVLDAESARRLDAGECFNLIFAPGFSTKEEISDVSGRGVGMDVVKNSISRLNGTIDIDSKLGEGTTIAIKVPLTLAILPTLMVRIATRKFALPMSVVREIFDLDRRWTNLVDGRLTVMVRQKAMPLFFLERWLDRLGAEAVVPAKAREATDEVEDSQVVSVTIGHQTVGLVVDDVIGLEEVVIKPLGAMLHGLPGLAGSTITGDGSIALIVDIPSLIKQYGSRL